jgi:hypothetical protein
LCNDLHIYLVKGRKSESSESSEWVFGKVHIGLKISEKRFAET